MDTTAYEDKLNLRLIVEIRRSEDKQRWWIAYYMINLEQLNTDVYSSAAHRGISKIDLKVGDKVGWSSEHAGCELFGEVVKINPKKAKVRLFNGDIWSVPYSLLFSVHDGYSSTTQPGLLIEGNSD